VCACVCVVGPWAAPAGQRLLPGRGAGSV
jgi:hypothetical protein